MQKCWGWVVKFEENKSKLNWHNTFKLSFNLKYESEFKTVIKIQDPICKHKNITYISKEGYPVYVQSNNHCCNLNIRAI